MGRTPGEEEVSHGSASRGARVTLRNATARYSTPREDRRVSCTVQGSAPMAYASAADEMDHLDQKITNALHQIDDNFSEAREASTALLKNVQRFGKEIGRVHEGLKVWKHFFASFCDEPAQKLLASADSTTKKRHSPPSSDSNAKTKRQRTDDRASSSGTPLDSSGFDFSIDMSPPKTTLILQEPDGMPASDSDEGGGRSTAKDGTVNAKHWRSTTNERWQQQQQKLQ